MASTTRRRLSQAAVIFGLMRFTTAFSFTYGAASQCDDFQVSWTGGTAPFQMLITPNYGVPRNYSIPTTAYSNGKGTFSTPLLLNKTQSFLLTMSDSTGFNTGGTTDLITVGASKGGSCDTTPVHIDWFYQLDSALVQCRTFTFGDYTNATQPVTIYGFVPAGDVFTINPPKGPTSYDWTANLTAGTQVLFSMYDAQGRSGGSAEVRTVGQSDATSCLGTVSPETTSNAPSGTATSTSPTSTSSSGSSPQGKPNTAVIVGAVVGVLIALACLASLGFFFWRRRRAAKEWTPNGNRHSRAGTVDLLHTGAGAGAAGRAAGYSSTSLHRTTSPFDDPPHHLPPGHEPEPFMLTAPVTPHRPYSDIEPESDADGSFAPGHRTRMSSTSGSLQSSAARRKAAMAGQANYNQPASRFILHTDIEEAQPDAEGVIELPPQYSERRRPMESLAPASTVSLHSQSEATPVSAAAPGDPFLTPNTSRRTSDEDRSNHAPP